MVDKPEEAILRSLRRITRAIDLHSRWLASNFGLTIPQLICLRTLVARGALTASELAQAVDLSQATVTGIVDRLVRRDLVTRERSQVDRRRVVVEITDAGRTVWDSSPSPLQERFLCRLVELPPENQQVIRTVLEQVVRMMGAESLDAAPVLTSGPSSADANAVGEFLELAGDDDRLAEDRVSKGGKTGRSKRR